MLKPIQETFRNIFKEKGLFFSSLLSLLIVFVMIDLVIFGIANLNNFKSKMENSNQGIVYVKTMTEDEINTFQGKLLQIEGIQTIKYSSKESALELLEKELTVDLSNEENPLFDSFYIYVNKNVDANKLKEELLKNPEIIELQLRADEINKVNNFSKKLDKLVSYGTVTTLVFFLILMSNIMSTGVKTRRKEIRDLVAEGASSLTIKFTFFLENLVLVIISSVVAFYIFNRLQLFIVEGLNILSNNLINKQTNKELMAIYLMSLGLGILMTTFLNFVGLHGYFRKNK